MKKLKKKFHLKRPPVIVSLTRSVKNFRLIVAGRRVKTKKFLKNYGYDSRSVETTKQTTRFIGVSVYCMTRYHAFIFVVCEKKKEMNEKK